MNHVIIRTSVALTCWMAAGCAMLEMPTLENMTRERTAAARGVIASDPSPARRAEAAEDLGNSGDPTVLPLLVTALSDSAPAVRLAVVEALADLDAVARTTAPDLSSALQRERDPSVAVAMAWQLRRWGADLAPARDALRAVLAQPEPLWRYHAAILLDDLEPASIVLPVFVDTLGSGFARDMRNKPEDLLEQRIPSDGALIWSLIDKASQDTANSARRAAVMSLARHFKPFPAAGPSLLARGLRDTDARVRAAAAWSCLMAEPEPVANGPILLSLLSDPDAEVRANSARALGQLEALRKAPAGSVAAIGRLMADDAPKVRVYAADALGSLRDLPEPVLLQIVARMDPAVERETDVRAAAAAALGFAAPLPAVKEALRRGFDDADATVRQRCLATMGHLGVSDPGILEAIARRTAAPHPLGERLTALGALRDIGPAAMPVRDAVLRAQNDPDPNVREGAGYALGQIDR